MLIYFTAVYTYVWDFQFCPPLSGVISWEQHLNLSCPYKGSWPVKFMKKISYTKINFEFRGTISCSKGTYPSKWLSIKRHSMNDSSKTFLQIGWMVQNLGQVRSDLVPDITQMFDGTWCRWQVPIDDISPGFFKISRGFKWNIFLPRKERVNFRGWSLL